MAIDPTRYARFVREMKALQQGLSSSEYLATLEAKLLDVFGKAQLDADDLLLIQQHVAEIFGEDFRPFAARIVKTYQDTLDLVNTLYDDLGVDLTRDMETVRAIERANGMQLGAYKEAMIQQITQATRAGLLAKDDVEALRARFVRIGGKAKLYARVLAETQIKVVARGAKAEKARIAEVPYFEYVGLIRETTRPFCAALVGSTHHIDTIRDMRNGNKEPVLENCGGWRCIHDWEPDPFAKRGSDATFITITEGKQTVKVPGGTTAQRKYDQAKEAQRRVARQPAE